ncbi:MAG: hypothetical protein WCF85_12015 [Rhodospirillaceae bacterium]
MIIVAQTMVLTCAVCGLLMFIYINLFSYRRLRRQERQLDRADDRIDRVQAEASTAMVVSGMNGAFGQEALFYLYQEQVRRFIDAKIDIMRSSAETQNRILLMQAEVVRNSSAQPSGPMLLEASPSGEMLPATIPQSSSPRPEIMMLSEQMRTARAETDRHLAAIDEQMRSLPGPSIDHWVAAQNEGYSQRP